MLKVLFFIICFSSFESVAQRRLFSEDSTQHIYFDVNLDNLFIVPPIALYAKIPKEEFKEILKFQYNINILSHEDDGSYVKIIGDKCKRQFERRFRGVPHYTSYLQFDEQEAINLELKNLEKTVRKENKDCIYISEETARIFSKYPANQYLLTDIEEYYMYPHQKFTLGFTKIQCFLIDGKSRQVKFYDYRIWENKRPKFSKVLNHIHK